MKKFLLTLLCLIGLFTTAPADELQLVAPKHLGAVQAARLSPDGKFALISGEGGLSLWETATARRILQFEDSKSGLSANGAIAWRPDGRVFAVALRDKVQLWSLDTLKPLRSIAPADPGAVEKWPDVVQTMAFDGSGKTLATGSYDRSARLWDVATGKLTRVFRGDSFGKTGHSAPINGLAFANQEQWLVTVSDDGDARVWDVATGKTVRVWNQNGGAQKNASGLTLTCVAVAPDGQTVAVGSGGFNRSAGSDAFLWNATSGATQYKLHVNNYDAGVNAIAFSPDGKTLLAGISTYSKYDDPLILWDVASGQRVKTFAGHAKMLGAATSVQFAADGKSFLSGSGDETVRLWNVAAGKTVRRFAGSSLVNWRAELSFDGQMTATGLENGDVRVCDAASGRLIKNLKGLEQEIYGLKFSPDARLVAASAGLKVMVWDVQSGRAIGEGKSGFNHSLAWSADSSRLLAVYQDGYDLFAVSPGEISKIGNHYVQRLHSATLSADGKRVYAAHLYTKLLVMDTQTDAPLTTWALPAEPTEIVLSPDETLLASLRDNTISVWNARSGAAVASFGAPDVAALAFDQSARGDAKTLVTLGANGALRFFDARSGKALPDASPTAATPFLAGGRLLFDTDSSAALTLKNARPGAPTVHYLSLRDDDWLAYTDDGRFDGSPGGIAKVSFARGQKTYALEQFAERFYRPGLMQQVLGDASVAPPANAQNALAQGAPPTVKIVSPRAGASDKESIEVTVEAKEQNNGGVKAIRLYQNGRLVGGPGELRGIVVEAVTPQESDAKTSKFTIMLAPGANVLRAVAYSQTDLESQPDEVRLSFAAVAKKPVLHVVAIGINQYKDVSMNLTYARPDAESLVQFFRQPKNTTLFSDTTVVSLLDEAATGEAIKKALSDLSVQSQPEDVVFIYLAGHGDTAALDARGDDDASAAQNFYFLPYEMRQMIMKDRVRQFGVSGAEINGLIEKIAARKIVLVYDACKSGAAIEGATRGAGDEQQALAKLARAQGIYVLTASTGQQYAAEVKSLGHGILTYALLEGLSGKAAGGDSTVKVSELFAYADDRVPVLAKEFRGREQWPVSFGRGQNFPLTMK